MPKTSRKSAEQFIAAMNKWPEDWLLSAQTLDLGKALVAEFVPFVHCLVDSGLASSTISRHMDNLWTLGNAIVGEAEIYPENLELPPVEILDTAILGGEGPLIAYTGGEVDEAGQKAFERTTRKLAKFRGVEIW